MERARLSTARNEKGWSQEYVAEKVGVDPTTVQRWEHGKTAPQPHHRLQLCKLFEMSAWELDLEKDSAVVVAQNAATRGEDTTGEAYQVFRTSHLTMRLFRIVWNYPCIDARYQELQTTILLELEDNSMEFNTPQSRRDALRCLASLAIDYCSLSALQPIYRRPTEEILVQCAAGMTACWELRKGKDLAFTSDVVMKYLPTLQGIVSTASSQKQRQAAADLTAQGCILLSLLANHLDNRNNASLNYAQQAVHYAETADNLVLQILALRAQSNAHDYANHWQLALEAAQKAMSLLETSQSSDSKGSSSQKMSHSKYARDSIPPILASYVYAGLANYQGHNGQKQDALISLKKAHKAFFAQPSDESIPGWIHHEHANLLLQDGLTYYYLGLQKEAIDSFDQISKLQDVKETTRVEALIDQVLAEVEREDKPRNMDFCMVRWKQGMREARALKSEARFNEAVVAFTAMRAAWPSESCIKDLRQHIIHW